MTTYYEVVWDWGYLPSNCDNVNSFSTLKQALKWIEWKNKASSFDFCEDEEEDNYCPFCFRIYETTINKSGKIVESRRMNKNLKGEWF